MLPNGKCANSIHFHTSRSAIFITIDWKIKLTRHVCGTNLLSLLYTLASRGQSIYHTLRPPSRILHVNVVTKYTRARRRGRLQFLVTIKYIVSFASHISHIHTHATHIYIYIYVNWIYVLRRRDSVLCGMRGINIYETFNTTQKPYRSDSCRLSLYLYLSLFLTAYSLLWCSPMLDDWWFAYACTMWLD